MKTVAEQAVDTVFAAHDAKANHDQKVEFIDYLLRGGAARLSSATFRNDNGDEVIVVKSTPKFRAKGVGK